MSTLKNIKDFDTWSTIKRDSDGIIVDDDEKHKITDDDDLDDINQVIKRALSDDMKKMCGGIRRLETEYENDKIYPLYKENSKKFSDIISVSECGYCSINDDLKIKSNKKIEKLFAFNPGTVGKGEVLMSCIFPDVKLSRRKFKDEKSDNQTPDCEYPDGFIEAKSFGSEFEYIEKHKEKENIDKNFLYSIVHHMKKRCHLDKNTVFVFFDNDEGKDNVRGFFWIKCGKSTEKNTTHLVYMLQNHYDTGNIRTKPKKIKFSVSCKDKKLIIHPRN